MLTLRVHFFFQKKIYPPYGIVVCLLWAYFLLNPPLPLPLFSPSFCLYLLSLSSRTRTRRHSQREKDSNNNKSNCNKSRRKSQKQWFCAAVCVPLDLLLYFIDIFACDGSFLSVAPPTPPSALTFNIPPLPLPTTLSLPPLWPAPLVLGRGLSGPFPCHHFQATRRRPPLSLSLSLSLSLPPCSMQPINAGNSSRPHLPPPPFPSPPTSFLPAKKKGQKSKPQPTKKAFFLKRTNAKKQSGDNEETKHFPHSLSLSLPPLSPSPHPTIPFPPPPPPFSSSTSSCKAKKIQTQPFHF